MKALISSDNVPAPPGPYSPGLADFPAFNAVYEQKFTGVKPVRTTVRVDLVAGLLVEITVVARASQWAMEPTRWPTVGVGCLYFALCLRERV